MTYATSNTWSDCILPRGTSLHNIHRVRDIHDGRHRSCSMIRVRKCGMFRQGSQPTRMYCYNYYRHHHKSSIVTILLSGRAKVQFGCETRSWFLIQRDAAKFYVRGQVTTTAVVWNKWRSYSWFINWFCMLWENMAEIICHGPHKRWRIIRFSCKNLPVTRPIKYMSSSNTMRA